MSEDKNNNIKKKSKKKPKITKGMMGYIDHIKNVRWAKAIILLILILCVFGIGYFTTGTRKNLFTFASILACLPFAKWLVAAIIISPYKSATKRVKDELYNVCGVLPIYYDYVFNDEKHFYSLDCLVVMKHNIIGYSSNERTTGKWAEDHLKKILINENFKGYTIKIWDNLAPFKDRLEEMDIKAQEEGYLPSKEHMAVVEFLNSMAL